MEYERVILEPSLCEFSGEAIYQKPLRENQVGIVDCLDLSRRFGHKTVLNWDVAFGEDRLIVFAQSEPLGRMTSGSLEGYSYLMGVRVGVRPVSYLVGSDFDAVDSVSRVILGSIRKNLPPEERRNYGARQIHIGGEFPSAFILKRIERKYSPR